MDYDLIMLLSDYPLPVKEIWFLHAMKFSADALNLINEKWHRNIQSSILYYLPKFRVELLKWLLEHNYNNKEIFSHIVKHHLIDCFKYIPYELDNDDYKLLVEHDFIEALELVIDKFPIMELERIGIRSARLLYDHGIVSLEFVEKNLGNRYTGIREWLSS